MSGDKMGGLQDVLILSRQKTEVFQGHQLLTSSQDPWGPAGLKRDKASLQPWSDTSRHGVTGETVPFPPVLLTLSEVHL